MVTVDNARKLALYFEGVVELPHFHLTSFRANKKIFSTMDEKLARMMVILSLEDQSVFCAFDKDIIYPVPNKWGQKGATYFELKLVKKSMLKDALTCGYNEIFKKKAKK